MHRESAINSSRKMHRESEPEMSAAGAIAVLLLIFPIISNAIDSLKAREGSEPESRQVKGETNSVVWVVQLSDLHFSVHHPERAADFKRLIGPALAVINLPYDQFTETERMSALPSQAQRHILAGLASVVGGLSAPYEKASHVHERTILNWLWATRCHPFGPFANVSQVSQMLRDVALRNTIDARVDSAVRKIRDTSEIQTMKRSLKVVRLLASLTGANRKQLIHQVRDIRDNLHNIIDRLWYGNRQPKSLTDNILQLR